MTRITIENLGKIAAPTLAEISQHLAPMLWRTARVGLGMMLAVSAAGAVVACSEEPASDNAAAETKAKKSQKPTGSPTFADGDAPPPSEDGCAEEAKLPYVLSRAGELYRFDVPNDKFDKIGALDCTMDSTGDQPEQPISMAVDRGGTAWISTTLGKLLKVDVRTAKCQRVEPFDAETFDWGGFGMGFAVDSAGSSKETLFISELTNGDTPSKGLGTLDVLAQPAITNPSFAKVGDYAGELVGANAELTGTGDGRLFAFVVAGGTRDSAALVQLDKKTGATIETVPLQLETPWGYAFSFYGGDFYFYSSAPGAEVGSSQVTRLKYSTDKTESVVIPPLGFDIVGAGVSTCAPISAVK